MMARCCPSSQAPPINTLPTLWPLITKHFGWLIAVRVQAENAGVMDQVRIAASVRSVIRNGVNYARRKKVHPDGKEVRYVHDRLIVMQWEASDLQKEDIDQVLHEICDYTLPASPGVRSEAKAALGEC